MALQMGVLLACQLGVCSEHTDSFPSSPSGCTVSVASAILGCLTNVLAILVELKAKGPGSVPGTYLASLNFDEVSTYHHRLMPMSGRKAGGGGWGSLLWVWVWLVNLGSCTQRHYRKVAPKYTDIARYFTEIVIQREPFFEVLLVEFKVHFNLNQLFLVLTCV